METEEQQEERQEVQQVPTLNNVVRAGDESLIQTKRISNEIGNELDANLGPILSQEIIQALSLRVQSGARPVAQQCDSPDDGVVACAEPPADCLSRTARALRDESEPDPDETLELMIDDIIDRHITALRQDIRALLDRALDER